MAQRAQDTFTAEIDGVPLFVQRGQVFADKHPVVKLDAGRGLLFRPLEDDEPQDAAPKDAGDAPAEPVPVAEQKAAGVAPEDTVTIADQKAGVPPPELPLATEEAQDAAS